MTSADCTASVPDSGRPTPDWPMPTIVLVLSLASAACLYGHFLGAHRALWHSGDHDRNAHYLYALELATAVRNGNVYRFLDEVQRARVWPPLQGLLTAGVLLVGGLDYRLAVLPSLAGWVGTAFFAALLARRAVPRHGDLAGLTAALFVLASPSHRAYATDVMLESLGGCLTLLVLYCYARAAQCEDTAPARWLGLALTALFLHKYNYWLLAVFALLAADVLQRPWGWGHGASAAFGRVDWGAWARAQLRNPLTYVLAGLLLAIVGVIHHGDRPIELAGWSVSLYPPHNIVQVFYGVLVLRFVGWWRGGLGAWVGGLDVRLRQVVRWHVVPALGWLLLPKHLSFFLWYLSLDNASDDQHSGPSAGVREYGTWAVEHYHLAPWLAHLAAGLMVIALLSWRRLRPGGRAALCLVVIAASLAVVHPNRKARNLHSWLAGAWVVAGGGLASLLAGPALQRAGRARPWLGGAAVGALGIALGPALWRAGDAPEGGPHLQRPSLLDLTDFYRDERDQAKRLTVLASLPIQSLVQWTTLERDGRWGRLEDHWYGFGDEGAPNREGFARWLASTSCDTLVYFERLPAGAPGADDWPTCRLHAELRDLLRAQQRFRLVREQTFPRHGCRVLVWKRGEGGA